MEDVEVMTLIKERIDRLTEDLGGTEQKITFLEQSIEKAKTELEELKIEQAAIAAEEAELRAKLK